MPADTTGAGPPMLNLGGLQVPYSLISLVTLTVQNSALTILLHYVSSSLCSDPIVAMLILHLYVIKSRTAPNAKPYSAAAAVLLNEILKGTISSGIALNNIEPTIAPTAAHARYTGEPGATSLPGSVAEKKLSMSQRKRDGSLGFGQEEAWTRGKGFGVSKSAQRAWWLDYNQISHRLHRLRSLVFR